MTANSSASRRATASRRLARLAAGASAVELLFAAASLVSGGFILRAWGLRLSVLNWTLPLSLAVWLSALAAWLFHHDAARCGEWDAIPRALLRRFGPPADRRTQRLLWASLWVSVAFTVLASIRIAGQALRVGSYEGAWLYVYGQPVSLLPFLVAGIATAIGVAAAWAADRIVTSREWAAVLIWLTAGLAIQAAVVSLAPHSFARTMTSDGANGFYNVTLHASASDVLADFDRLRHTWPVHANSNMPGKLLVTYALEWITLDPGTLGWLILLLSNAGSVMLYAIARDLFDDPRVALAALALYLVVPGKFFFMPEMNTVTPTVAFVWVWCLLRWLRTQRVGWAAAAGAGTMTLLLFDPLPLALGLLAVGGALPAIVQDRHAVARVARQAVAFVLAAGGAWAALRMLTGFDLIDTLWRLSSDAVAFNAAAQRPYNVWVRADLDDFVVAIGACPAVLFLAALIIAASSARGLRDWWTRPIVLVCLSLAATLLALDLAGINRGEVVRLWIFLACAFQLPAAWVCAQLRSRAAFGVVFGAVLLEGALCTSMIEFVRP